MGLTSNIKDKDWVSVRQGLARLGSSKLGPTSTPTFLGVTTTTLTISGLTTDSLIYPVAGLLTSLGVATNGQIPIGSTGTTPVLATITGTANQVISTPGAGSITLSTPQDIHTGASPTFASINLTTNTGLIKVDGGTFLSNDGTRTLRFGVLTSEGDAGVDNTFIGYHAGRNNSYGGGGVSNGDRNVYIGPQAGEGNTGGSDNTGSENIAVGNEALQFCTSGYENTCVGDEAGKGITSGHGNVCMGNDAMQGDGTNPVTGNFNTAIGTDTLYVVQSGGYNVAVGYQCLFTTVDDDYNVGVGYQCLYTCGGGENNVGVGYCSLYSLTTGNRNFAVGPEAGYNLTEGVNNIYFGYQAGYNSTTANDNIYLGYQAGYNSFDPTIGENTIIGFQSFYTDSGQYNIGIGYQTGYYNDTSGGGPRGKYNLYIGHEAGRGVAGENKGRYNVGFGYHALYVIGDGAYNVAIGSQSQTHVTDGDYNTSIGAFSLHWCTTGESNFAFGNYALADLRTTHDNIAIGFEAGQYQRGTGSVFIGTEAGEGVNNGTGRDYGVYIGYQAGKVISTNADYNTIIGAYGGFSLTTGVSNTFIGYQSGYVFTSGASNVMIGPEVGKTVNGIISAATESNLLVIGNQDPATNLPLIEGYFAAHASGPALIVNGKQGISIYPTAYLTLPAGTAAATTAPLKFTSGTDLTTPEAGVVEYDGTHFSITEVVDRRVISVASGAIVASTSHATDTETVIYTAPISANELHVGKVLRISAFGDITTNDGAAAVTLRVKLGAVTVVTLASTPKVVTDEPWHLEAWMTIRTIGAGGTVSTHGHVQIEDTEVNTNVSTTALDTTGVNNLTITAQWAATDAGDTFTIDQGIFEVLN